MVPYSSDLLLAGIHDIKIFQNEIYILHYDSTVHMLDLMSVPRCIAKLCGFKKWTPAAQLSLCFRATLLHANSRYHCPVSLLTDIRDELYASGQVDLSNKVSDLLAILDTDSDTTSVSSGKSGCSYDRLVSGIYLVHNRNEALPHDHNDTAHGVLANQRGGPLEASNQRGSQLQVANEHQTGIVPYDSKLDEIKDDHENSFHEKSIVDSTSRRSPLSHSKTSVISNSSLNSAPGFSQNAQSVDKIPIVPLTIGRSGSPAIEIKISPGEPYPAAKRFNPSKSDSPSPLDNDSGVIVQHNSSESLHGMDRPASSTGTSLDPGSTGSRRSSLNSMSSNELMFATPSLGMYSIC